MSANNQRLFSYLDGSNLESIPGVSQRAEFFKASEFMTTCNKHFFVGKGRFGVIRKCLTKGSNQVVAAKCYSIYFGGDEFDSKLNEFRTEINSMVRVKHPNIVQVLGWTRWGTNVAVIMEYVDGNTLKRCLHKDEMSWDNRIRVVYQLALALKYLHNYQPGHGLRHVNVKPDNIIVTRELVVKLADFGAANIIRATGLSTSTSEVPSNSQCTILYAAPETKNITVLGDMYSFAIVVYEIITMITPFSEHNVQVLIFLKQNGTKPNQGLDEVKQKMSSKEQQCIFGILHHIMQSCWHLDSNNRWKAKKVVDYVEKSCMHIMELNTNQDSDIEQNQPKECVPCQPDGYSMAELSSFIAPFEECSVHNAIQQHQSRLSVNNDNPVVQVFEHCFGFSATTNKPKNFPFGNQILYSLDGSFEEGFLWHSTVNPATDTNITGVTEKIDLKGNRVPSDWLEADRAIFRTFTGSSRIRPIPVPVINVNLGSPKSVIFTLRNDNLPINDDNTDLYYDAENVSIETGVLKRGLSFPYILGLAIDKTARLSLLQFALVLAEEFGASNVRYVSYSTNDERWRRTMNA